MRHSQIVIFRRLGTGLALLVTLAAAKGDDPVARHAAEVESWQKERVESLKQPDSWLTLVGLGWLEEGENTCGSDPESDVVLPESTPAEVGVFHLRDGRPEFEARPGAGVLHQGRPVERIALVSDADGEPTVLEIGPVSFFLILRSGRYGVRIKDRSSPTFTGFRGLEFFPVAWDYRVEARFLPYDPPRKFEVPTILGTPAEQVSPGAVVFELFGETYRLDGYEGNDETELFFVFGDKTNGRETYGGGRFLYARHDGGKAVVDFNKAYSPPCVFTPYATCPIPTPENRLPIPVKAGEKAYADH